jgi:MFS family permease
MVNIPLYSATVLERDTLEGGLLLLRMTVLIPIGAIAGGWLGARFGERVVTALGALAAALGLWLASGWTAEPSEARLARDLLVAGLGFGLLISPLTAAVMKSAGSANSGIAAGIATVSRLVGMMLALAALTPWALSRFNSTVADLPLPVGTGQETKQQLDLLGTAYAQAVTDATVGMFNDLFLVGAILCAVAVIPAVFLTRSQIATRRSNIAKP